MRVVTGQWILGIRLIREDRAFTDDRGKGEEWKERALERRAEGETLLF